MNHNQGKKSYSGGGAGWAMIAFLLAVVVCVIAVAPFWRMWVTP